MVWQILEGEGDADGVVVDVREGVIVTDAIEDQEDVGVTEATEDTEGVGALEGAGAGTTSHSRYPGLQMS